MDSNNLKNANFDDYKLTPYLKKMIVFASGGYFLDGFLMTIIGIAMGPATEELGMTSWWQGAIGAAALIGMFFGGIFGGYITDPLAVKKCL